MQDPWEKLEAAEDRICEYEKQMEAYETQHDRAVEAERRLQVAEARIEELEIVIENAIDRLEGHEHEDVFGYVGHVDTVCVVSRSELCDVLDDLKEMLDEREEEGQP